MKTAQATIKSFAANESGATAIEYVLIASLLSIVIIGSVVAINGSMTGIYERIRSYIVPALEGSAPPGEG